ncbi:MULTISPECIES: HEXXH motif-containing putative peptide modification protein [unclassified Bacillus (in: firmicutes)]|uniref:aKG-HExxH-type peptide beta-hydroxylase n=1 Tax=unclassified Bacillus (in: firmicutes) TaxID=185979 RepID=UPI0006980F84|nr:MULTISPECIES: HEXXH motif-containing putative peptide modification protein [unclassified Bacillus (in: firmicutes)]
MLTLNMDTITEINKQIKEGQARKIDEVSKLINKLDNKLLESTYSLPQSLKYSLIYHTIYNLQLSLKQGHTEEVQNVLDLWKCNNFLKRSVKDKSNEKDFLVVDAATCVVDENSNLLSKAYIVNKEALCSTLPIKNSLIESALELISSSGNSHYLEAGLNILILINEKQLLDTTNSYSIKLLPGTVFTDWTNHDFRLAEAILHESVHNWLNECLDMYGEDLSSSKMWFSPWKNEDRPAFGIVHACMAFSVLSRYFAKLIDDSNISDLARNYAKVRLETEVKNLYDHKEDIYECISLIREDTLRDIVLLEFENALDFYSFKGGENHAK